MSVNCNISQDKNKVTVSINGRFDFSLHQDFKDAYSQYKNMSCEYILDLSQTDYMDSSALGMILLLKDHVEQHAGSLVISKPSDAVSKVLTIAQFHRLMKIEN